MEKDKKRKHQKEMIMLIGSMIIVVILIAVVGWLVYQSLILKQSIPEYAIAFFSSIATLIIGYTIGKDK